MLTRHALVPTISKHVSHRGLYTRYKALGGGELALYSLPRTGSRFYEQGATEVSSIGALFDFYEGDGPFTTAARTRLVASFRWYQKRAYAPSPPWKRPLAALARWRCERRAFRFPVEKAVGELLFPEPVLS